MKGNKPGLNPGPQTLDAVIGWAVRIQVEQLSWGELKIGSGGDQHDGGIGRLMLQLFEYGPRLE